MTEKTNKIGHYTTTYKVRLYTNHLKYLKLTSEIYNELIKEYYDLLFDNLEFLNLSNQNCLRELEKLTIKSRTGEKPQNYIDIDAPVYLRRAAINQAIGYVRNYTKSEENFKNNKKYSAQPKKTKKFNSATVFYKGMYKDLEKDSIKIKLFDGSNWRWFDAKLKGWNIPDSDEYEVLSPTIVIGKDYIMAHIGVKKIIQDVTPIKERMQQNNIKVCGIAFSNSDSFAICIILDENKNFIKAKFIKGGNEYRERTNKILSNIKKHRQNGTKYGKKDHKSYWEKLNHISDYYAHKVSKEITDFCIENGATIISITDMEEDVTKHFGKRVGKYSPIYLRKRIVQYLQYKTFKQGILITRVRKNYTANKCYICRANVKRKKLKYECENGHIGDYFVNSAMNIGIMCFKKFGK